MSRYIRPSPDRIIESGRPHKVPQVAGQGFWLALCAASMIAVFCAFLIGDGIARAFDRPAACHGLTAYECTAKMQETR